MALKPFNQEGSEPSSAGFQRQQRRQGPVPFTTKLAQGFSALPGQHKDWAFNTLLLLYYSQVLGLSASLAALAIAASLLIDAITDPMVGAFSDSFRSRLGRRHGLMLASILPTCGAMFALFSPPETLQDGGLAAWMLACSIVLRISFTFFAVPWGAIAAELSEDYAERTTIIAYRMLIGGLGGVIFIFFIYALFPASDAYVNGLFNPASYPRFAAVIATLMAFWMLLSTLATLDQIKFLPQPNQAVARPNPGDMIHRVYAALANKNFRVLFVATLIAAAVVGTGQVFDTYMNTFFWGFGPEELKWMSLSFLGMALSIVTVGPLQRRFEKRNIMLAAVTSLTVLQILKVSCRFAGWLPDNHDPLLLPILVAHACLMLYSYFLMLMMFASMIADVADQQELQNGLRQEGIFSGGISFSTKVTTGAGLTIGGLILEWVIVFPVGSQPGEVSGDILRRMAIIDGIVLPALNLVPFVLLLKYTLSREAVAKIQHALDERRNT
ncbi:MAG: MFS transporter [Gammaproteobacteria bacterium]|jgi:glycoside/pentoside/hexuronide:cation symporter, GPH family|nr:MFS transporter [Gammaproteobacteria bacterium]